MLIKISMLIKTIKPSSIEQATVVDDDKSETRVGLGYDDKSDYNDSVISN